jgi:RecB family exonuclease
MTPGILSVNPPLAPLQRVSPSRFQALKECPLRELRAAAGVPGQLPAAPAARLGSAIHRLLEEAGKGLFRHGGPSAIENRWNALAAEAESMMHGSWLERHLVPLKAAVPDFEVRRLRAIKRAQDITEALPAIQVPIGGRLPSGTEVWVSASDGVAGGFIDQVEATAAGPVLRDYKSGHILEPASASQSGSVKEAYEIQMKLYAAIYANMTGVWPARLELVPLQGPVREVIFTATASQALLDQARDMLVRINTIITTNPPDAAEAMLAAPTPDACRYCLFRPSCLAYRQARDGAAEDVWPVDLWGKVDEKRVLGNGRILLIIDTHNQQRSRAVIRGLTAGPDRHPALAGLLPGDSVAAFGLRGGGNGSTFQESSWSVIYRLEE